MNGWCGKIARIDLERKTVQEEKPESVLYRNFIGGRGLAGHYMAKEITRAWDDPQMPLLFFTGPLGGTDVPSSGHMTIMSRSPLTGTVGDADAGGGLATALKQAGWDGLIITGKHAKLCGIEIVDDRVTLTNAEPFRGWSTDCLDEVLQGKGSRAIIGPAAEHGVRFANIVIDRHFAAGRNGIGLSFAAKNIKYLTARGTGKIAVNNRTALDEAREDICRLIAASPALSGECGIAAFGTAALYDVIAARRMMPTRNFRETYFEDFARTNASAFGQALSPRQTGCHGCPIRCRRIGFYGRAIPEFEAMSHFSALLGNRTLDTVVAANALCNALGMDAVSAAATLATFCEIDDRTLAPGQILTMLEYIGQGQLSGVALGQGAARYAAERGRPEAAMTVKGQELSAYDPRGAYGLALSCAVSTRGGCPRQAFAVGHEILRKPVATDRFTFSGKARIVKAGEDRQAVVDSLPACPFVFLAATLEEYARALTAVTGIDMDVQHLLTVGERICYQERIMNAMNGFTAADDDLPARFFTEAGSSGSHIDVPSIDREAFLRARAAYYEIRGLDETGRPRAAKATELGLAWTD